MKCVVSHGQSPDKNGISTGREKQALDLINILVGSCAAEQARWNDQRDPQNGAGLGSIFFFAFFLRSRIEQPETKPPFLC